MSRIKPYAGNSRDRLTALINQTNSTQIKEGVDFRYEELKGDFGPNSQNTSVKLVPMPGTPYLRIPKVYFWRLSLEVLENLPAGEVQSVPISSAPFWIHDKLDVINQSLGLDLQPEEVHNDLVTSLSSNYTLRADGSKSFAWVDSSYTFVSHVPDPRWQLDINREAEGFWPVTL